MLMQDVFVVLVCFEQLDHQHQQQKEDLNLLTSARRVFKSENYFKNALRPHAPGWSKGRVRKRRDEDDGIGGKEGKRGGVGKRAGMVKERRRRKEK